MVNFKFIPLTDPRLTAQIKEKFINVGQLINWDYTDSSGKYSGIVVIGEKEIPQGFQSMADITLDIGEKEISMAKIQEVSGIVSTELRQRMVVDLKQPGTA
jgi:hypothetical protein